MSLHIQRIILLAALLFFLTYVVGSTHAQGAVIYRGYLPIVQQPSLQIAGEWRGVVTQAGAVFDYQLSLTTSGSQIAGTARVSRDSYYAIMRLTGSVVDTQFLIDEQAIIDTNGAPAGTRWCVKTLLLAPDAGGTSLSGTWKQDGCNTGRIYIQHPSAPVINVTGNWSGTVLQGSTPYTYTLALNQQGSVLEGLATTRSNTAFGTFRLKGAVVGTHVILQETEVIQSSGTSWCLKTLETQQSTANGRLALDGTWSALGCIPGRVLVVRQ